MKILTQRALLINKILVIADIHCGIESDLYRSGISIPSQIHKIEEYITKLIKQTKAKHLIILGDLKHMVPGTSNQEFREIPKFLENLSKKVKITIVKGNHDADLEKISNVEITSPKGLKIGNYGFVHGHAWFSKKLLDCEYLVTAHIHPAIEFKDNMKEPCWIICEPDKKKIEKKFKKKCKIKQVIIMPAFNPLIVGAAINKSDPIGPITNVIKWKEGKIYLTDGTYLGRLNKIR